MIDLHIHTRASDGTWTAEQAAEAAADFGLRALAIADHDTLASAAAGMTAARRLGLGFITAVEITAGSDGEEILHILGYGVDADEPSLQRTLRDNQESWEENERQSHLNLARLGVMIDRERYDYWAEHREAGGWPTYNCLVEMGLVASYEEYFEEYFGPGKPAYVANSFVQLETAIAAIKRAGGVPILAHPGAYDARNRTVLDRPGFLDFIVEMGIEGFEAYARANNPAVTTHLLAFCGRHGLLVTGGSDCHGGFAAGRRLGYPEVPDTCLPPLLARLSSEMYYIPECPNTLR